MVGPGEGALTHVALVGPDPGVLPHVSAQLVGARELPSAALPGAQVRLLPRVGPHVRLHVGRLVVHLAAARLLARVDHRGTLHRTSSPFLRYLAGLHHRRPGTVDTEVEAVVAAGLDRGVGVHVLLLDAGVGVAVLVSHVRRVGRVGVPVQVCYMARTPLYS